MYKHILVPLDGSELAAQILPQVEDLAKALKSEITLITVGSLPAVWAATEFYSRITEEFSAQMKKDAEKNLAEVASKMKAKGLSVNCVYTAGVPAHAIIAYADEHGVDLIAMATHGRGEVAWVLGSVAEKVVSHSSVPMLLMRVLKPKPLVSKGEYSSWGSD